MFWLVATLDILLCVRMEVLLRHPGPEYPSSHYSDLARGQSKDNWLSCIVIWLIIFSEPIPARNALFVMGALSLAWLVRRTLLRLRALGRKF